MHKDMLVVSLRPSSSSNRFYKETNGKVYIPSGEEYEIYIKNLNSVGAVVTIEIDGKNAYGSEESFFIRPNETFTLKGDRSNRAFKYIRKTEKISQHRGDKIEDGIIRVSYQFEEPLPEVVKKVEEVTHIHNNHYGYPYWHGGYYGTCNADTKRDPILRSFVNNIGQVQSSNNTITTDSCSINDWYESPLMSDTLERSVERSKPSKLIPSNNDVAGITVQGSEVNQNFVTVTTRKLQEQIHVIILQLFVETVTGNPVTQKMTSRQKTQCKICGQWNSPGNNFCYECGAAVV